MTPGWKTVHFAWHYFDESGQSRCGKWSRSFLGGAKEREHQKAKPSVPSNSTWAICKGCLKETL